MDDGRGRPDFDSGADDSFFERLADACGPDGGESVGAPSRLKSRVYSRLMKRMAQDGPIESVHDTGRTDGVCVFEQLVRITPLTEGVGSLNFCRVCHARVLAENVESAPIYWGHCPYVQFQNDR